MRLGEIVETLLARAGVAPADLAQARRVLVVHAIGSAAFATTAPDTDRPIPPEESRRQFTDSLRWLLTGITQTPAGVPSS